MPSLKHTTNILQRRVVIILMLVAGTILVVFLMVHHLGPPSWLPRLLRGKCLSGTKFEIWFMRHIGVTEVEWHAHALRNRALQSREVRRGWDSSRFGKTIFRGDYYNTEGKLVSTIRDGDGVAVQFHSNGVWQSICLYADRYQNGPAVLWHSNGMVRAVGFSKSGVGQGLYSSFYDDGTRNSVAYYESGRKTWWTNWYEAGGLKERGNLGTDGTYVVESFGTNGDIVEILHE